MSSSSKRKIETTSSDTSSDEVFEYTGNGQTVPKDIVSVRFHPNVIEVDCDAFRSCQQLREVVLNEGLREIESSAFNKCTALQSIEIPSTVIKIGAYAFSNCKNLTGIVLNEMHLVFVYHCKVSIYHLLLWGLGMGHMVKHFSIVKV